jgi:aminobenzoyl-glutamate utilization protein B
LAKLYDTITMTAEKEAALSWIDENQARLSDFHQVIYNHAEPAWREYRSCRDYVALLRDEGFDVEAGSGGMPTAFVASWGSGKPILGTMVEYDAVPGYSQQPVPERRPRDGLHPWAAGHTDPHSALGLGGLTGVLAAKHAMEKFGISGTLRLFGEPAEKVCGSKPVHAARGYYDDLDAAFSYHPYHENTTVLDTHCGSYWSVVFTFQCPEDEPWVDPALLRGAKRAHALPRSPGALDAVTLMYTTTKATKENMYPHTAHWTMNEAILVGGQATADNLAPRISQIQYAWRSPLLELQQHFYNVLCNNARHAARMTNTTVHSRWVTKTRVGLRNLAMARITYANMALVGPTQFGEEARAFARKIQQTLGIEPMDDPFTDECQTLTTPDEAEAHTRETIPPWQQNFTSDDYVEYAWHAPTVRYYTGRPLLREPFSWSHWGTLALNGVPAAIDPTWLSGGRTLATTAIDLLTQPPLLAAARAEFEERTGGGIGGSQWVAPLLGRDFQAPIDLPWPEYVETPRGREWYLPTPVTFGEEL